MINNDDAARMEDGGFAVTPNSPNKQRDQSGEPLKGVGKDTVAGPSNDLSAFPTFSPRLEILPPSQRALWPYLRPMAKRGFVLYGGTAIALRVGHRQSVDFDFFTDRPLDHSTLLASRPFMPDALVLQEEANTLTLSVTLPGFPEHPIKVSFYGNITMGRVDMPEATEDGVILAASMRDLLATKLKVIHLRAEKKDYLDIHGLLSSGLSLPEGLACASALFGKVFQPRVALTALTYFKEGNLRELPTEVQKDLIRAAAAVECLPPNPPVTFVLGVSP